MQMHEDDTIKTSETVLRKIYLSLYWKGCVWEGVWHRTELQHIDPHSIGHNRVSFPFSWAAQPEPRGPASQGYVPQSSIFSPTGLTSKISGELSYIIVQHPPSSCGLHNFALVHPVHGQGYNSDIPRPDEPVFYTGAFPIFTARLGRWSIYNIYTTYVLAWWTRLNS